MRLKGIRDWTASPAPHSLLLVSGVQKCGGEWGHWADQDGQGVAGEESQMGGLAASAPGRAAGTAAAGTAAPRSRRAAAGRTNRRALTTRRAREPRGRPTATGPGAPPACAAPRRRPGGGRGTLNGPRCSRTGASHCGRRATSLAGSTRLASCRPASGCRPAARGAGASAYRPRRSDRAGCGLRRST